MIAKQGVIIRKSVYSMVSNLVEQQSLCFFVS